MEIALSDVRGAHLLVALSGGADSVALLLLLCRARDAGMLRVSAAHFEHGIRGADSLQDAEFCQKLCERLGVQLALGGADVPACAQRTGEGIELCARRLRYEFLYETLEKTGASHIALAHHLDDQAETVLMHLLRGAGIEGVSGMRRFSGKLFRPLLDIPKSALVAFLNGEGEAWREDHTNRDADTPRNALRLNAIPALEAIYPGAVRALARFAEIAGVEGDYMRVQTAAFLRARVQTLPNGWRIDVSGDCEEALLRRALGALCGQDVSAQKRRELVRLTTAADIQGGMRAARHGAYLYVLKPFEPPPARLINRKGVTELAGICRITASPAPCAPEFTRKSAQVLDGRALEGAVLRTRRVGDRIAPLGMRGTKSLSDYFTDKKIDPPLRDIAPLIAKGRDILWVVGHGISRECALKDGEALRLECEYIGWGGFCR
ncbi:MAG: tRNA lysidine(34) synthetase TilS [Christensenellales bacterium]|jgi:tRNA(Ile)-lysidine synthase